MKYLDETMTTKGTSLFTRIKPVVCFGILFLCSCGHPPRPVADRTQYQFKETRDLVEFVNDAATLFSAKGPGAFAEFGKAGGKWFSGSKYIFIYDTSGNCVFHPVLKNLVGKNLLELTDLNGKPIGHFIHTIAFNRKKPYGWIHYLWAESGEIFPSWKNAYIVGVRGPDGKTYAVGSGTYSIRMEIHFITELVDSAARLVQKTGKDAYSHLLDPAGAFTFSNTYVFVVDLRGRLLVDPAYPTNINRNVAGFRDYAGQPIIRQLLKRMKKEEVISISYVWPAPGQANPMKKLLYARRVLSGTDTVIVGSSLYLMEPIWKKF